jgi:hypothetical protein
MFPPLSEPGLKPALLNGRFRGPKAHRAWNIISSKNVLEKSWHSAETREQKRRLRRDSTGKQGKASFAAALAKARRAKAPVVVAKLCRLSRDSGTQPLHLPQASRTRGFAQSISCTIASANCSRLRRRKLLDTLHQVSFVRQGWSGGQMQRIDSKPTPAAAALSAFLAVRNEEVRLPNLLDHYRKLGVGRFYFVDNDSTDSSMEFLLAQPDVRVWRTSASYRSSDFGAKWLQPLLDEFAHDHWALIVDADEFLVYPQYETVSLLILCAYLDDIGARALRTLLIDMYSDRPVSETKYTAGDNIFDICSYFDRGPYWRLPSPPQPIPSPALFFGGVRQRVFWAGGPSPDFPPCLTKFPLQRWRRGETLFAGAHQTNLAELNWVSGGLLHFKFVNSVIARANEEAIRKEHYNHASEYVRYTRAFMQRPDLSLLADVSIKYRNSQQLVDIGLMLSSRHYRKFCQRSNAA